MTPDRLLRLFLVALADGELEQADDYYNQLRALALEGRRPAIRRSDRIVTETSAFKL